VNLNLGIIRDSLMIPCEYICGNPDSVPYLTGVYPLVSDMRSNSPGCMYVTTWDELVGIAIPPLNVVCVGGGEEARSYFLSRNISGLIFAEDKSVLKVMRQIQEIFAKYNALEVNLLSALVNHQSIREVLNACGRFFSCHVMLFGTNFELIENSDNFLPHESDSIWRETLMHHRSVAPMVSREKIEMTPSKPGEAPRSMFIDAPPLPPHYNIAFDRGDLRVATMIFYESGLPLSRHARWLVDYVAETTQSVIIERYYMALGARNHLRTSFVTALQYSHMNSALLLANLKRIGWNMNDDYRIILVNLPPESRKVSDYLYNYENIFAESYSDLLAMHYNDYILILLHGAGCTVFERSRKLMEQQLLMDDAVAAVGKIFCGLSELKIQYELAVLPMHMRTHTEPICMYTEAAERHLISELSTCFPIHAACHYAAVRIFEFDQQNGTDFLRTLETYLLNNQSLKESANALFVHRNTVTYRLARISNICQINFDDPTERFHILLSCIALRVLNKEN